MQIICPIHGLQPVAFISQDIWDEPDKCVSSANIPVSVIYEWEGRCVNAFIVSAKFARDHQVMGGHQPVPTGDFPDWTQLVVGVCKNCLQERSRGEPIQGK